MPSYVKDGKLSMKTFKETCVICGREINEDNVFTYVHERYGKQVVPCLCNNKKCVEEYSDRFGDAEPDYDVEEVWQNQQDDLWERDALYKHPDDL